MTVPWSGAIGTNLVHFTREDGGWSHMGRDLTRLKKITRQLVASQTVVDDVFIIYGAWTRNDIVRRVMLLLLLIVISSKYAVKIGISWVGWRYSFRSWNGVSGCHQPVISRGRYMHTWWVSIGINGIYIVVYTSRSVWISLWNPSTADGGQPIQFQLVLIFRNVV